MEHTARMALRSWLITGASSGLGNAFARAALGAGDLVTATARRPEALAGLTRRFPGRVTAVGLDVRDAGQCQRAVETALARQDLPSPPLRLALGEDAVSAIRAKITA